jgi:signal transduction histidine kinase
VARYSTLDKLLLLVWLPIVVFLLALHVREVMRTGLAQPPVFATPPGDDGYPRVGGYPLEVETRGSGLEVGDKLVSVGGEDLRGRGYLGFMGIALEKAGISRRAPLVFEREGVRHETQLEMRPFAVPWLRVPFLVMWTLVAALLLLRSPRTPVVQRGAIAIGGVMICQALFFGGPRWQTSASVSIFFFAPLLFYPLGMRWIGDFPGREFLSRRMPGLIFWSWFTGVIWVAGKLLYLTGTPFPSQHLPVVVSGLDAIGLMPFVATMTWNYLHADAVGRRRLKWAAYGGWIAAFAMISALAAPVLNPDWPWFEETLGIAGVVGGIMPIGFLIAIAAYNLLDVDRLISATASYTLLLAALFALTLALVPRFSVIFAGLAGLDAVTTQLFLSVLLAALIVPLNRRLRPRLDRFFFPEQRALESGVEALLGEIEQTRDESGLLEAMARGLHALFRSERAFGYEATADGFAPAVVFGSGAAPAPRLDPRHSLVILLTERSSPLVLSPDAAGGARKAPPALGHDFLATPLLLPVRRGRELALFVALGPKRSGDVYTASDLALLSAVGEAGTRQLERLHAADVLAEEREHRREEARRRRAAEDAHFARSRHLAGASHDLRQPLHALGLFADALEKRVHDDEARELVQRMRHSVDALREMFDGLIDVSRLEQGAVQPVLGDVELDPLLERLANEAEPAARAKGLELRRSASGLRVHSDPVLLGRILQNLVVNAVRYTREGQVALSAVQHGNSVHVVVSDTGPGIPEERRETIFAEFVRLEEDASVQGLGLGLAIVDRLVRLLGHHVVLESLPGRGSSFRVELAAASSATRGERVESDLAAGTAASPGALAGRRVLVIDDDLDILIGMRALLEEWGAQVTLAASAEEALECVEMGRLPDAVVADYRLGDALGTEVVEAIRRAVSRRVPAIVVTGSSSEELLADLARHGVPHLSKPIAPARLRAALVELLRG